MGFALDTVDDAFILHLLIGALLGPTFLGIYLYYKYNIIDKLSNSQVGIDIFSDHIILHGDHHTFHLPIKNLIVKVEPILHLKIKNSGIIIISSDDKHYYLHMNKDVDKFLIVLDKLKIKNSTYLIPSVGVIVVAYSLLIFPELNVKISYDWIIFSLAFLFLLCRHITWIYKSENHKHYKEKFKTERKYLFRFSFFGAYLFYSLNFFPLSLTFWKYQYAESLIEQHKYKQGFARLEEIIKEDSKSNYLNTYAWFLTTAQDINVRDYAKATHLAQIALEKSPNNAMIADTLACAYHAKGDKEKANELATKYKLDKRTEEFRLNMLCQSEGHEPINKSRDMASQKEPTGLSRK